MSVGGGAAGRRFLVTGSTSGIGRSLAEQLAAAGAWVDIVARNATRGEAASREIAATTGSEHVTTRIGDLGSLASVRTLARDVQEAGSALDGIVHCAGVFLPRREVTQDGYEAMFATNHLGPFLLTELLRETLLAAPTSRVLVLSAPSTVKLDFADLQAERSFRALHQFGASKAANLLFTFELARRMEGTGVTANAVHPGLARTRLMRGAPAPLRWATWLASRSADRVARDILPQATSPEFADRTGRFFHRGREISPPPYTLDEDVARKLWDVSLRLSDATRNV
jgi:NAD(P)-dependent dehydrogenase (short-subunit alcohol dehydrogenase family)